MRLVEEQVGQVRDVFRRAGSPCGCQRPPGRGTKGCHAGRWPRIRSTVAGAAPASVGKVANAPSASGTAARGRFANAWAESAQPAWISRWHSRQLAEVWDVAAAIR